MKPPSLSRRRRVPYGLPDLGALECTSAPYFDKAGAIATRLRQIAAKTRNDHLQPFYSMRAVADHFHVPPTMVSRIYRRLAAERLVRTVWGSRTLLEANRSSRNSESQSIGIAIDLGRFLESSDYRVSILSLQFEMWNHEIIDQLLFFEEEPGEIVRLCTRNHHPHINTIVWLLPEKSHNQTLLRLHDLGLRVICLSDHVISGIADCYTVSSRYTIRTIVRRKILQV
jgi:DNA-binding transcriptional regulator YhcF (GntR family)